MRMKVIMFCSAALFGMVHGLELGQRRVIVSGDPEDPCVMDSDCYNTVTTAVTGLLHSHGSRDLSANSSEDGGLRGARRLLVYNCDPVCAQVYGIYVCLIMGWCRRRTLAENLFGADDTREDDIEAMIEDPCWVDLGMGTDLAFAKQIKDAETNYDVSGLSYRVQVRKC